MAVSPDGRRVAVTTRRGLAVMDDRGRVVCRIPQSDHAQNAVWSPDGRYLLFFGTGSKALDLGKENPAGAVLYDVASNRCRVIAPNATGEGAFRGDGRKVALFELGDAGEHVLVERDIPSGEETARYNTSALHVYAPSVQWLPGRDAVAYLAAVRSRGRNAGSRLYVMMDGEERSPCPYDDVIGFAPVPDGKGLVLARSPAGGRPAPLILETYDFASRTCSPMPMKGMPSWLTSSEGYSAIPVYAAFSPDTSRLAVSVYYEERRHPAWRKPRTFSACFVMTADGSHWRMLRRTIPRGPDTGAWIEPQWSRNGSRIAVMLLGMHTYTVSVFQADGTGERRLVAAFDRRVRPRRLHRGRR